MVDGGLLSLLSLLSFIVFFEFMGVLGFGVRFWMLDTG